MSTPVSFSFTFRKGAHALAFVFFFCVFFVAGFRRWFKVVLGHGLARIMSVVYC